MSGNGLVEFEASSGFSADASDSIHIHIEDNSTNRANNPNIPNSMAQTANSSSSSLQSMLSRVRHSTIGNNIGQSSAEWRMNFNNLRTLISNTSGNFRYNTPSSGGNSAQVDAAAAADASEGNVHRNPTNPPIARGAETIRFSSSLRRSPESQFYWDRGDSHQVHHGDSLEPNNDNQPNTQETTRQQATSNNRESPGRNQNHNVARGRMEAVHLPPLPHAHIEEDNSNIFTDIFIRVLGNFVRYLPFIAILFIKFIHDHLLGILDILLLQSIIYVVNRSLRRQVSKLSDKNIFVLVRDFTVIAAASTVRFLLTASSVDPYGLILSPPTESMTIEISSTTTTQLQSPQSSNNVVSGNEEHSSTLKLLNQVLSSVSDRAGPTPTPMDAGNAVTITKAISLGLLIYYVAVNDLFLKMLTILTKIFVTMLPNKVLRHKQRAQMYALIEYFSQFYRALVPTRQWVMFLFKSYSGLEVISGILFSAFYVGAKGFEFASRGKVLHSALSSFIRNMDYDRKPTKDELEAAGVICPICHDSYNTPIILTCNHIFCDDCVSQWFKREQTCPMCRAKVSDDPHWQDGSTTFFYQLC